MNKDLYALLQTDRAVKNYQWSAGIELYDSKVPGLLLAVYRDFYWVVSLVSDLRVVQKVGNHWVVTGSMLDSPVISELAPKHRLEVAKIASEPWHGKGPVPIKQEVAGAYAWHPLEFNGVSLIASTIQPLAGGGVSFVSRHDPMNATISEPTLIKWEWMPNKGLEAVAWIWGDQWGYDAKAKSEVAEWQTADKNKKGSRVILSDLYSGK